MDRVDLSEAVRLSQGKINLRASRGRVRLDSSNSRAAAFYDDAGERRSGVQKERGEEGGSFLLPLSV
jgi:hypothetical protein